MYQGRQNLEVRNVAQLDIVIRNGLVIDGSGADGFHADVGLSDGRTLSVVSDIARKSPVIITMTINMGVKTAWPVITRPIASRSTCTIFLRTEFSV